MSNATNSLRLADIWAFCHGRLNETAIALLAHRDGHQATVEPTPYRDVEFGLADIAFKRSMLEEHGPTFPSVAVAVCPTDGDSCSFTQGLAALYETHPDYQESWRP